MICGRYIKHASLINNCYPSRPDEKGPKSSELSYLVFYTTSKPAKLTKVGTFIERRVIRDRKKKLSDVHCSLEIIKTLIQNNKAHLNIFSKNIVNILDSLLVDISDLDIVRHCQNVFSCFCAAHDGSTLGVDHEFRTVYDRVVSRFAGIATLKGGDNVNRFRLIGLRALEYVVSSSALYACEPKAQLNLVLPAILDCLIDSKNGVNVELESADPGALRRSVSIHAAVHPDNVVTDEDVTAEGIRCLRALFKSPNGGNVKLVLGQTFTYLDEHNRCWWPSTFGISIVKAIVNSIQPQYRYMVANEIIARIDSVDSTTSDPTLRLQKKATLIAALEAILTSSVSLIGMPVLEILHSLLTALTRSLAESSSMGKDADMLALESIIQDGLVKCVGGLATHIYYSNQVPHIISHIAGKLSSKIGASPQPTTIDGVPTVQYRAALLKCLLAVIKTSKDNGRQEASFHAAEISSDLLTPCLGLLLDQHVEIRTAFAQALITFLVAEDEGAQTNAGPGLLTSAIPSTSSDLYFRTAAHQTLHVYASSSTLTPKDLVAIYGILKALFTHFQDDEFIRVVPVLFSLQDWCLEERAAEGEDSDILTVTRKRAVAAAIVSYFQMVVSTFGMAGPQEYIENIKRSRESEQQWVPIEYKTIEESLVQTTESSWQPPSEPASPVLTHPLAREHLVTLLTTVSDRFRAGADRFNLVYTKPEGESDLLLSTQTNSREFGSGVFLSTGTLNGAPSLLGHKGERSSDSRIRVSRHLEDWALPKIFPQGGELSPTEEEKSEGGISRENSFAGGLLEPSDSSLAQRKIGVDNLKAALAAAQMSLDATSDGGSSSAGSNNGTLGSAALQRLRRQQGHSASTSSTATASSLRPELADLLNTIKADKSGHSGSRLSLVVPPY
ncbi:hypothetical protein B0O80DRAFT_436230 [Mortierella sp. GBAus27b]|nr:hypothetical protein B0O80DRAFT_436230 [Mortierella sp. GBAus27b]